LFPVGTIPSLGEAQARLEALYGAALANRARTLAILGLFFAAGAGAFAFSLARITPASAQALSAPAVATDVRPLELHIAQNGLILLRSAKIVSIHGSALTLATNWGSTEFTWVARTNSTQYDAHSFGTKLLARDGSTVGFNDFQIGDLVTVTGTLDGAATEPTIEADSIRHTN
jgi:hypothetical protein